jgi:hypothetical protein
MRRVTATAVALGATLALVAGVPAANAATGAATVPGAGVEERNYEVHAYGPVLGGAEGLTFQVRPQQRTWSLTISFEGIEVTYFAGTYTTSGDVSTFINHSFELPSCDFRLVSEQSGARYAGLSSCRLPYKLFPIKGLFLLEET